MPPPQEVTLSIVATTDLHGHVEPTVFEVEDAAQKIQRVERGGVALLGGYLKSLRRRQPVVLLDAGDLFQGTLTSNLSEGQVVIDAYNLLGYTAVAVGNHEFDYGPVGPRAVPRQGSDDDPTGALKARIAAARFPFLSVNVLDERIGRTPDWPNLRPSHVHQVPGGPLLGLIGATAEDTRHTTNPLNLRGLAIEKIVPRVTAEARRLRERGVHAVILAVHEGANCRSFADPRDLSSCKNDDEHVLSIARGLAGAVDAIVGGHSHAAVAHFVGDVPVVQAFSAGRYFGRIDLTFRRTAGGFALDRGRTRVFPPQELCQVALPPARPGERPGRCDREHLQGQPLRPAEYEGGPVAADEAVARVLLPHVEKAQARRAEALGVTAKAPIGRSYRAESSLGVILADLIREGARVATSQPIDFAFQNGGGIRNDLPKGSLTYGHLYEVLPFDNRLAVLRVPGSALIELYKRNLRSGSGVLTPSGLTVEARCDGSELQVVLRDERGKPIDPGRTYTIAVSDFLAAGGDNFAAITKDLPPEAVTYYDDAPPLREIVLSAIRRHPELPEPAKGGPRLRLPMPRPVTCGGPPPLPPAPPP